MNKNLEIILKILGVILALYLFLVGINGLSSGIKMLGGGFAKEVMSTTSNPFVSLFIGRWNCGPVNNIMQIYIIYIILYN